MDYSFNPEWDELDEDLREEKITAFLERGTTECPDCKGEGCKTEVNHNNEDEDIECVTCHGTGQVSVDTDDAKLREEAEDNISAHFPIYF